MSSVDNYVNCKLAIDNLQKPEYTIKANEWLTNFFKTKESWEVCVQLLSEEKSIYRFFGSISLYGKIQRDLVQLDSNEHVGSLFQTLINSLLRCSQTSKQTDKSSRYICLSIAAISVQMNSNGIVQQLLSQLNPIATVSPQLLLELLTILPEECYNYHTIVNDDFRSNFANELLINVADILNFLYHISQSNDQTLHNNILKCLENWIIYTEIQVFILESHPILRYCLEFYLKNQNTFESTVDVLISICKKYEFSSASNLLLNIIIPCTLSLESLWDSQIIEMEKNHKTSNDMEVQLNVFRSISRLVTELAESLMDYQFLENDEHQQQILNALLIFLIKCVNFKYDFNIARIPLKFFYDFSIAINKCRLENKRLPMHAEARIVNTYSMLTESIVKQMELPNACIRGERKISDTDEDNRLELSETICDCSLALGTAFCVKILCTLLQREITSGIQNWSTIESILFASTSIIFKLTRDESHLCSEIIIFVGTLPDLPGLKVTTVNLIKSSAGWLRENPKYVPDLLTYICNSLSYPTTMLTCSKALANISRHCYKVNNFPTDMIISIYEQNKISKILTSESESYVVESICYALASFPEIKQNEILEQKIFNPILQSFQIILQSNQSFSASQVIPDIDIISTVYRFVLLDTPSVLISNFLKLHPIMERILQIFMNQERVIEKVCRCYKYIIKTLGSSFGQFTTSIAVFISVSFKKDPFSAYIYLAAILFSSLIREENGIYMLSLFDMLNSICETFLSSMDSLNSLEKRPDLVEGRNYVYFI